ncbi:FGGY-family carbohydrate kinase [Herbivorax sp. ANBcel31]|uniref:xylulokinase n=1 Tax=Herbivorax sp. ANBcel31 TaxID=3069754 RepID=UPI0027B6FE85|nr:FGGY-family carbohydrate kinase [Herbivorax sp. ANBcel31]MDQ2087178.1 FGGY-family carbohydrate kinase [Herbivorax sp. ANBcel31]
MRTSTKEIIKTGKAVLGIEFGSTRIKAVLVDPSNKPIAKGFFEWENRFENGFWTYHIKDVWKGLQSAYRSLCDDVKNKYGIEIKKLAAIGFSAMMHGYLAFDREDNLLVPFRTWRNTTTEKAAKILTSKFSFKIPLRWSIAHLYQAVLDDEKHVKDISFITTLAGYVHWQLTGQKVLGVGDASGMFPVDSKSNSYDTNMVNIFNELICDKNHPWGLQDILPQIKHAGEFSGKLTKDGVKLIDPTENLEPGIPICPPEGDAATGLTATNCTSPHTGCISSGTSIFSMVVLEKSSSNHHNEFDMVATPTGNPVAMVHCNNCTSDLNAWVKLFCEISSILGGETDMNKVFETLYKKALDGSNDCGGLLSYNFLSGEPVLKIDNGIPMFMRLPDSNFDVANFMRAQLYTSMSALKISMDALFEKDETKITRLVGHGGLFKTKGVAQRFMAGALNAPISVIETADEGGAWGISLLASYMLNKEKYQSLENFLLSEVFDSSQISTIHPCESDTDGFQKYLETYKQYFEAETQVLKSWKKGVDSNA